MTRRQRQRERGSAAARVAGLLIVVAMIPAAIVVSQRGSHATATTSTPPRSSTASAPALTPFPTARPAASAAPSQTAVPSSAAPPNPAMPPQMLATVRGYIAARENANSYYETSTADWLVAARPYLSPAYYASLVAATGSGEHGYAYAYMHGYGWKVTIWTSCAFDTTGIAAGATGVSVTCGLSDQTVNGSGAAVPVATLPTAWPYTGTRPPAVLQLVQIGGVWLVDRDVSSGSA